jgi:transcriptional regulator with PAS, ATPase and Fis domain
MPLGFTKIKSVNIRVLSATHRNLTSMVATGQFREDLFYRLNCLHFHIPALRERGADWALLLNHYLDKLNETHGVQKRFSMDAINFLKNYAYPGDIRELRNIVETGFRVSDGSIIQFNNIIEKLQQRRKSDLLSVDLADYYSRMVDKGESFWEVIHAAFLNHDLNRCQVKAIIQRGLMEKKGSFKGLLKLFNVSLEEYKKFLNFLRHNNLKP